MFIWDSFAAEFLVDFKDRLMIELSFVLFEPRFILSMTCFILEQQLQSSRARIHGAGM